MATTRNKAEIRQRMSYRLAVQASLEKFYNESPSISQQLADSWWEQISLTSAFKSGLFMHSEPINTAADIVAKEVVEISAENEAIYDELLRKSRMIAIQSSKRKAAEIAVPSSSHRIEPSRLKRQPTEAYRKESKRS